MKPFETLDRAPVPGGGELVLHRRERDLFLHANGTELMSTRRRASEEHMADLVGQDLVASGAARVLLGGLGLGFTLVRLLGQLGPPVQVDLVELVERVVDWNRRYLPETSGRALADPRVRLHVADVVDHLAESPTLHYRAIALDVDNGPGALVAKSNGELYGPRGLSRIARALAEGGTFWLWSARREPPFESQLERHHFRVRWIPAKVHAGTKRKGHGIYAATKLPEKPRA